MGRVVFKKGKQRTFLEEVRKKRNLTWSEIAHICNVCERTIRDWRREKYYMNYKAATTLSKRISANLDKQLQVLPDYWNLENIASIGAKRRYEIYGNPGTPEGRKKGGMASHRRFPQIKNIIMPRTTPILAEFIGILLGDGGITKYQTTISFNRETDKQHAIYMQRLIKKLFGISSSITSYSKYSKADKIVISGRMLVEFLVNKGLKIGNKIYNRIDIPAWIMSKKEYKIACLRGLIDTDGSFYSYRHRVNGKIYDNFAMCFTSHSDKVINSVHNILTELKFKPSLTEHHIYLHRKMDIETYFKTIGSNNPKHVKKYNNRSNGEVRKWL